MHLGASGSSYRERVKASYARKIAARNKAYAVRIKKGGFVGKRKRVVKAAPAPTKRPAIKPVAKAPRRDIPDIVIPPIERGGQFLRDKPVKPRPVQRIVISPVERGGQFLRPKPLDKNPPVDYIQEKPAQVAAKKIPIIPLILVVGAALIALKG